MLYETTIIKTKSLDMIKTIFVHRFMIISQNPNVSTDILRFWVERVIYYNFFANSFLLDTDSIANYYLRAK